MHCLDQTELTHNTSVISYYSCWMLSHNLQKITGEQLEQKNISEWTAADILAIFLGYD